ncbi:CelD/BcsL family acetyltransferase involved in cellulose biosynthesis [Sinorhizobium fredii]
MEMAITTVAMLACMQLKHFVADYVMQPAWILRGKGNFRMIGGYVHAGGHALGTVPALMLAGAGMTRVAILVLAEFVAHYLIDYGKALLSRHSRADATTRTYWAMHGADQLMHQLTYAALILAALL